MLLVPLILIKLVYLPLLVSVVVSHLLIAMLTHRWQEVPLRVALKLWE